MKSENSATDMDNRQYVITEAEAMETIRDIAEGEPEEQCRAAMHWLQAFLHSELSETVMDVIREHVAKCEECMDEYRVEQAITQMLRRCNDDSHASSQLSMRISRSIRLTHTTNSE